MLKLSKKHCLLFASLLLPTFSICLSSCSVKETSKIVVANWESYMSNSLINRITHENNVQYLNFATNEEIETKFKDYYDVAVPSSYEMFALIQKGWIEKIDWKKFNLYQIDDDNQKTSNLITNGHEALCLFSNNVQQIIEQQTAAYKQVCHFKDDENILDYGIPYFLQNFIFAYKGDEINEITNANNWSDFLKIVSPKLNPNIDERFKPTAKSHIAMVDDARTIYDLANLIKNQELYPNDHSKWDVNPSESSRTIKDYKNDYSYFTSKYQNGYFYLNSDSGQILSSFSQKDGNNSAQSYNGDILYAATGGGINDMEYDPEDPDKFVYDTSNFHIYNPACSPLVLEFVVMNNKNDKASEKHLNDVYDVVKKMVLENADDEDKITEYNDENEEYTSGPMNNFDEVNYTSPLKLIDDFVINGDYFNVYDPNNPDDGGYTQKQVDLFKEIYSIPDFSSYSIDCLFEKPISDLDKSNMHWAFNEEKEKI